MSYVARHYQGVKGKPPCGNVERGQGLVRRQQCAIITGLTRWAEFARFTRSFERELTSVRLDRTKIKMRVRSARHKGLKALIESDDGKGIRAEQLKRVRNIIAALIHAENMDEVSGAPGWRIHQLVGDRAGGWSISVSGNWRITFDLDAGDISNLDLEDYH